MENVNEWGQAPAVAPSDISIKEFEKLCERIDEQRTTCDQYEDALKEQKLKLSELETKAMFVLKELGLTSYKSKSGTFYINHRLSVTVPKDPEKKAAFLEYLRADGMFDALITVNANSLTSYYKSKQEQAVEQGKGLEFAIPGIEEPKVYETLAFRRANQK